MNAPNVVLSVLGLLPLLAISQTTMKSDPPTIEFFRGDLHRDLSSGSRLEIPPVLRPSPEFVVRLGSGNQVLLSSFRGKVVALIFVHTTCPFCQDASKTFTKLQNEYGPRGFQPIAVAFDSMSDQLVPEFVKKFSVTYPVAFSSLGEVMAYLGLPSDQRFIVPQVVWIARNGEIRAQTPARGGDAMLTESYWRNMIEMLVSESGGSEESP